MMKSNIFILILIFSNLGFSAEQLKCSKKETTIVFINGANAAADKEDVPKNVEAVEKLTQANALSLSSFNSDKRIINDSVYNNSKGLALDMVESFAQSLMIRLNLSRDSAWKAAYSFFSGFSPSPPEASITPNEQELLNFQQLEELKNLEIADTNLLKEKIYNEYLSNDYKTIIFSHSQGNLFIDVAHKELLDQAGFLDKQGILGNLKVAAPVHLNFAIPNNQYVINNLDIFLADLSSERKTIDIVGSPIDPAKFRAQDLVAHHSLIGTYLNFANLKEEITQKLIDVAIALESNCEEISCEGIPGRRYTNPDGEPGGIVGNAILVFPMTTFIGKDAKVCGGIIFGGVTVTGQAIVVGNPFLAGGADSFGNPGILMIKDRAKISGSPKIFSSTISGSAKVSGRVYMENSEVSKFGEVSDFSGLSSDPPYTSNQTTEVRKSIVTDFAKVFEGGSLAGATVSSGGQVYGNARIVHSSVTGNAKVYGNASVEASYLVNDALERIFDRESVISGNAEIYGQARVVGSMIKGSVVLNGDIYLEKSDLDGFLHYSSGHCYENYIYDSPQESCYSIGFLP